MSITPNEFVHWLMGRLEEGSLGNPPTLQEIYGKTSEVVLDESTFALALAEHEKYLGFIRAGFTEAQAFTLIMNDRRAMFQGIAMMRRNEEDPDK